MRDEIHSQSLMKRGLTILILLLVLAFTCMYLLKAYNLNFSHEPGEAIDSLNHVVVYYNGGVNHVSGRNLTADGYNLGLKYQCVEFVKRYYFEMFSHKMPDSYGHAVDFFDRTLVDGDTNKARGLMQCSNPSAHKPAIHNILVFDGTLWNKYGHVAIVTEVSDDQLVIIQQNPGPFADSRVTLKLIYQEDKWQIANDRVLGWLHQK